MSFFVFLYLVSVYKQYVTQSINTSSLLVVKFKPQRENKAIIAVRVHVHETEISNLVQPTDWNMLVQLHNDNSITAISRRNEDELFSPVSVRYFSFI